MIYVHAYKTPAGQYSGRLLREIGGIAGCNDPIDLLDEAALQFPNEGVLFIQNSQGFIDGVGCDSSEFVAAAEASGEPVGEDGPLFNPYDVLADLAVHPDRSVLADLSDTQIEWLNRIIEKAAPVLALETVRRNHPKE